MLFIELFLIAVGLSMDAFAVSVCAGLTMKKITVRKALIVGLYFGVFQAGMPLIGYVAASYFAEVVTAYSHLIAFALLGYLGGKMIYEGIRKRNSDNEITNSQAQGETSLGPKKMLPLAVATSIDALAVGISFAFLQIDIIPAVILIGITTLLLSMLGVKIGNIFGQKYSSKAEIIGGIILILIGVKILLEGMGVISL